MLLGQGIHARACGEVIGALRAAMQHDDQWAPARVLPARNVELVAPPSGSAGIGPAQVLSAVGDLEGFARLDSRQAVEPEAWESRPAERRGNVTHRQRHGWCDIRDDIDREWLDCPHLDSLFVLRLGLVLDPTAGRFE